MFFHPKNLKSENNNPLFKPWFNILLHTQPIVCATVDSQCLEYLGYITLSTQWKNVRLLTSWPLWPPDVGQSMCGHGHKNCLPQLILTDFYIACIL